jgi:hypothetical protein
MSYGPYISIIAGFLFSVNSSVCQVVLFDFSNRVT